MIDWGGWLTVICAGIVTLLLRAAFIVAPAGAMAPGWLLNTLKYVAAAVLPALIAPDILFRDAAPGDMLNWCRIFAAVLAAGYAIKFRNVFGTLVVGMMALWLLKGWVLF